MATRNHIIASARGVVALCFFLVAGTAAGCQAFRAPVDEGSSRTVAFVPGQPNFDMDAFPAVEGSVTSVEVHLTAPLATLTFVDRGDAYTARVQTIARILTPRGRRLVAEEAWTDTIKVATYEDTQQFDVWPLLKRIAVEPGVYVVEVELESIDSGASAVRRQRVSIPDPSEQAPASSGLRLSVRRGEGGFQPFASVQLPAGYDSLYATLTLLHPEADTEVEMRLVRFRADTSYAGAPFEFAPTYFDLRVMGIDYDNEVIVQRSVRRLDDPDEQVDVVFLLPPLDTGSYRVEVVASSAEANSALESRREFSVMPPSFPRVETLDQMIDALVYIARRRELRVLRAAGTLEERRARFDAFWGSLFPNRQEAAAVMKQYYSRVEEANILFSNHKEGWKTDRGMIMIVFGMPAMREQEPRREIWRYSLTNRLVPDYVFDRVMHPVLHPSYVHFMLRRSPHLEQSWTRAVDRWRTGRML